MIRKIARPMLASVYIADGLDTLINTDAHTDSTERFLSKLRAALPKDSADSIPNDPELVARAVGAAKVGAGSMLALGKFQRLSAGTLAVLAVPTILGRYAFWESDDKEEQSARRSGFLTNLALLGGLAITSVDTQGKPSLTWRAKKVSQDVNQKIQAALPTQQESQNAAQQAGEWISDKASRAQDAVTTYVDENKDDWRKTASEAATQAADTASSLFDQAKAFGQDAVSTVREEGPKWLEQAKSASNDTVEQARQWLSDAEHRTRGTSKRAIAAATKAQEKADEALSKAESASGRQLKKAQKQATKLQEEATKAYKKAVKKVDGKKALKQLEDKFQG